MSQPRPGNAEPAPARGAARETSAADRDDGFDGKRAVQYLEKVCRIGPRISGTEGMKQQQELLRKHFEALGGKVTFQRFQARQKSRARPTDMANMVVSWYPERPRRVILCSHYDTRPIADQEPREGDWHKPFLSANDGGSGVALLMELAHRMKDLRTEVGVDFVFFDGEEYIFTHQDPDRGGDRYFFGSEYFARDYQKHPPKYRYTAAVLLDMVGGKDPRFAVERNSWNKASSLVRDLWKVAEDQKCPAFRWQLEGYVEDDHLALNDARIPAVDLIDFNYFGTHWHKLSDVPANCSADSLAEVARVLIAWLRQVK